MNYKITTERLLLREIDEQDIDDLFEMDADPLVHKYIDNAPIQQRSELLPVISSLREQYLTNGIARWAIVDRQSKECLGWAGLKFFDTELNGHSGFYELGYRLKRKHWGKGIASEASRAVIEYGFTMLPTDFLYAITHPDNKDSIKVLTKLGFRFKAVFDHEGAPCNWFELEKRMFYGS